MSHPIHRFPPPRCPIDGKADAASNFQDTRLQRGIAHGVAPSPFRLGVEGKLVASPSRRKCAVIVAASLWEKKGERGGLIRQYRPNITTNHIRITQIYHYIECVFPMQLFWLSFFHHPSEISGCSFWCRKNAERFIWVWSCEIRIAETAGKCVSKCPQRSVLGATCFCSWFPTPFPWVCQKMCQVYSQI